MTTPDTIEQEIFIEAGIDHVWSLVAKTGFWVGDELTFEIDAAEGTTAVIETERYGSFPVQVERLEPPHYAVYRWASGFPGATPTEVNSTLVEFRLFEQDGGVLVRLKESGFASLEGGDDFRVANRNDNVEGWPAQLARLRAAAAPLPVS